MQQNALYDKALKSYCVEKRR